MEKLFSGRYGWKRLKRHRNRIILAGAALAIGLGVVAFVLVLALATIRLPEPLPDVRNLGTMAVIGLVVIGAVIYWLAVGVAVWRWFKARERRTRVSVKALNTARVVLNEKPKFVASTIARKQSPRMSAVMLSPHEFEQEVAWVFSRLFGLKAEVVGKSNDGGIDVKLYDATGTLVAIIQAKRYDENKALNPGFLRELDSCKRRLGVPRAYLVTTARFSADVRQQAQEMHIDLVDGRLFEEWRQNAYASAPGGRAS